MTLPHIDLSVTVGVAVGIIGGFAHFRTAKLGSLKTEVEGLCRQVSELTTKCTALEVRCQTLVSELDRADKKIVEHYTARIGVLDDNRDLHKLVQERDETIIQLQREIIEAHKNTLRKVIFE